MRWLLLLAAICAVVWLATVIWWQETHRAVDEADVLLFIVLLPLALFGLCLLIVPGVRALRRRRAAAAAAALATPAVAAASTAAAEDDPFLHARLNVHALAMSTVAGVDAESLLAALRENQPLARPSKVLFDLDGFRIPLARLDTLDLAEAEAWYEAQLKVLDPARHPADHERERILRCLALLMPALDEALTAIDALLVPPAAPVAAKPSRPSAYVATPAAPETAALRVVVLLPENFSEAARAMLKTWLEPLLARAVRGHRAPLLLSLLPTAAEATPVLLVDRFNVDMHREAGRDVLLLIGVDCQVDEASVRRLETAGRLRTATRPEAPVPGEAAFVLALSNAAGSADQPPLACLSRVASAERARPPEHRGKVSSAALEDAVQAALAIAAIDDPETCSALICDGDGFAARGLEAAQAMTVALPHLDAVADRIAIAAVLGALGAASLPALLTVAAAEVAAAQGACLIAPLAAPLARHALLALVPSPATDLPKA